MARVAVGMKREEVKARQRSWERNRHYFLSQLYMYLLEL